MHKPVQLVAVTMTGLLAGNEVGTLIGMHPALRELPLSAQIQAEQALTAHLGKVMPIYMTGTVLAAVAAAVDWRGEPGFALAVSAAGASVLMLGITLAGNVPVNHQTLAYPRNAAPAGWSAIRRRWEKLHAARVVLDLAAFLALTTAVLGDDWAVAR